MRKHNYLYPQLVKYLQKQSITQVFSLLDHSSIDETHFDEIILKGFSDDSILADFLQHDLGMIIPVQKHIDELIGFASLKELELVPLNIQVMRLTHGSELEEDVMQDVLVQLLSLYVTVHHKSIFTTL